MTEIRTFGIGLMMSFSIDVVENSEYTTIYLEDGEDEIGCISFQLIPLYPYRETHSKEDFLDNLFLELDLLSAGGNEVYNMLTNSGFFDENLPDEIPSIKNIDYLLYFDDLMVKPEYRNQKVGSRLILEMIKNAICDIENSNVLVSAFAFPTNGDNKKDSLIRFYKKNKFYEVDDSLMFRIIKC